MNKYFEARDKIINLFSGEEWFQSCGIGMCEDVFGVRLLVTQEGLELRETPRALDLGMKAAL